MCENMMGAKRLFIIRQIELVGMIEHKNVTKIPRFSFKPLNS